MANLHEIILALRSPETYPLLDMIRYALYRDRLNRNPSKPKSDANKVFPGQLRNTTQIQQGGIFDFDNAHLEVVFLAPDLVRVSWTSDNAESPPLPYAIDQAEWPQHDIGWHTGLDRISLTSSELELTIFPDGRIIYAQLDSAVLRAEAPPVRAGRTWTSQAKLRNDEAIFGLGEHAGSFNLRGRSFKLWNTDPGGKYGVSTDPIYMPIPVYTGMHAAGSYLLFYENYHRGEIKIDPASSADDPRITAIFEGGMLRHYLTPGPLANAIERYTNLTGRASMPPRWSLGYHQSRWGYKGEKDVRDVIAGFKNHNLPLSAIHLDIDYMHGYRVFTVDQDRFPDFANFVQGLNDDGIKTVTIIDPGVKKDPGFDVFQEGMKRGAFCRLPDGGIFTGLVWPGWSVYPDFTDPEARDWWGDYYQRLLGAGIAGIWHDMNEPCCFAAWGGLEFPEIVRHHLEGQEGDHGAAHNIYALQMNRAAFAALKRLRPQTRPWLVSRSGWAGGQRYAWNWTGDTESTWSGLKLTVSTVLSLGLSGIPYSGPDIGGFSGNPDDELYLRWFQLATFLPFFRTHSAAGTPMREPWVYGERVTETIRKFLRIRYGLLPYWYTLAWEATRTGHPFARPCFWYDDKNLSEPDTSSQLDDAFYLGNAFFVAPITEKGCTLRQVTLPAGSWYNFWDDSVVKGANTVGVPASLNIIPLFVRAGNLVPMEQGSTLNLHIYVIPPGESATGKIEYSNVVYADAGDGYGHWRLDDFNMQQEGNQLSIRWNSEGEFPFSYERVTITLHGVTIANAEVDNRKVTVTDRQVVTGKFHQAVIHTLTSTRQFELQW